MVKKHKLYTPRKMVCDGYNSSWIRKSFPQGLNKSSSLIDRILSHKMALLKNNTTGDKNEY